MDAISRIQPADPSALTHVDGALMRTCATAVLVHSVTVRHLPASVENVPCAVTITVGGSAFTTPTVVAEVENEEEVLFAEAVTNTISSTARSGSSGGGRWGSASAATKTAALMRTFKIALHGLNLLFPGTRRRASATATHDAEGIQNPREFALGVQVTVHSANRNHVFGSALCKTSGELASLSYPRGEASLSFRVYPCVNGVTVMQPLFNKLCLANRYLTPTPAAAAAIGVVAAAAAATAEEETEGRPAAADEVSETSTALPNAAVEEEEGEGEIKAESVPQPVEEEEAANETELEENVVGLERETQTHVPIDQTATADTCDTPPDVAVPQESEEVTDAQAAPPQEVTAVRTASRPSTRSAAAAQSFNEALAALIPCYTEAQRQAAFALYQSSNRTGSSNALTRQQVLHFIRAHTAYADACDDDEELLREALKPYITKRAEIDATPDTVDGGEPPQQIGEGAVLTKGQREGEGEAARPQTPRVDPGRLYYRPSTGTVPAVAEGRLGQRVPAQPLSVPYELFSVIALKLARA